MAQGVAPGPADAPHARPAGSAAPAARLPYTRHGLEPEDVAAVLRALESGRLAQGPEVEQFEAAVARLAGTPGCVAVSSGTTALEIALAALGVGPGDEVIVPALTFVATANAVLARGATPVFADVEPDTLNLAPASVRRRRSPRTRGAIAVHYAGHAADVDAIRGALPGGAFVLEDAAHALGATSQGRPVGSLGDAATFSFHPAKLVACGEGGAVTSGDPAVLERVRRLRDHGLVRDACDFVGLGLPEALLDEGRAPWVYELHEAGTNARMPELSAALGRSQLARAQALLAERSRLAAAYHRALGDCAALELPRERPGEQSAWHLYPVRLRGAHPRRRAVYEALHARGIGVQVHYVPVHLQPLHRERPGCGFGELPVAEDAYLRLLSLPLFPGLGEGDQQRVVRALHEALAETREEAPR